MTAPAQLTGPTAEPEQSAHPARGDRKACAQPGCGGTLQYGRRGDRARLDPLPPAAPATDADSVKGWVCDAAPEHFVERKA